MRGSRECLPRTISRMTLPGAVLLFERPPCLFLCITSREYYVLLHSMGAKRVEATLDELFVDPRAWESVSLAPRSA